MSEKHSQACYAFGPQHYECALQEIERLRGVCESVHDGLLRGYDDRELIALAAQGWGHNAVVTGPPLAVRLSE